MQQLGQPSVDEILESIKKVIARDNIEVAQAQRHRRETAGIVVTETLPTPKRAKVELVEVSEAGADEVLDLAQEDEALEESPVRAEPEPEQEPEPQAEMEPESEVQPEVAPETPSSEAQVRTSLAALSAASAHSQIAEEAPLERMVRDSIQPLVSQWLDANLPAIVDGIVREEIARIAGTSR